LIKQLQRKQEIDQAYMNNPPNINNNANNHLSNLGKQVICI